MEFYTFAVNNGILRRPIDRLKAEEQMGELPSSGEAEKKSAFIDLGLQKKKNKKNKYNNMKLNKRGILSYF